MLGLATKVLFAISVLLLLNSGQLTQGNRKSAGKTDNPNGACKNGDNEASKTPPAPVAHQCEMNKQQLDTGQDKRQQSKPEHNWVDLLNSISTAVVAAFTMAMVFVVYSQNRATKLAQRAWVVPDFEVPPPFSLGRTTRFAWKLTNRGQTPAWITAVSKPMGKIVPKKEALPGEPQYEIQNPFPEEGLPLTPNGNFEQFTWVTSADQANVEIGEKDLYIFGTIKYRDIFGSQHETRYCFKFNPALGGADPVTRDFILVEQAKYNLST